jgi:hypothetical protein
MPVRRFFELAEAASLPGADGSQRRNVLMLADDRHPANAVRDHIAAFGLNSRHAVRVVNPIHEPMNARAAWQGVDAVLIHYSIFVLGEHYLPTPWARALRRFPRAKLQIIQDEYRHIKDMKLRQAELGFAAVFSSLAVDLLERVYDDHWLRCTRYFSCLPGYVPERLRSLPAPPIAERPLDLVYRGRDLPFWLGRAGQEKRRIAEQMRACADANGLKADLDWTEDSRIYGDDWTRFLMSGRATVGVEGGSSIFDFDGCIQDRVEQYLEARPGAEFEQVFDAVLRPFDGKLVHRTLTPRILEAIAAKTALVLYPGSYRGVLERDRHYIALERDASNLPQVTARLRDAAFLQELVDRVHAEVIGRRELSTAFYVGGIDAVIASLCAAETWH